MATTKIVATVIEISSGKPLGHVGVKVAPWSGLDNAIVGLWLPRNPGWMDVLGLLESALRASLLVTFLYDPATLEISEVEYSHPIDVNAARPTFWRAMDTAIAQQNAQETEERLDDLLRATFGVDVDRAVVANSLDQHYRSTIEAAWEALVKFVERVEDIEREWPTVADKVRDRLTEIQEAIAYRNRARAIVAEASTND